MIAGGGAGGGGGGLNANNVILFWVNNLIGTSRCFKKKMFIAQILERSGKFHFKL